MTELPAGGQDLNPDREPLFLRFPPPPPVWQRPFRALAQELELEWARWFLWAPVGFGLGIVGYYALCFEPPLLWGLAGILVAASSLVLCRRWLLAAALAAIALSVAFGFFAAQLRTETTRAPVLAKKGIFTVTAVMLRMEDRGRRKGRRMTFRVQKISALPTTQWPVKIRVTSRLKGPPPEFGISLQFRAVLQPPPEPVQPGGYDFARKLWFEQIGAVGFMISQPDSAPTGSQNSTIFNAFNARLQHLRSHFHQRITAHLPDISGQFASALITGHRGGIPKATTQALRDAGLAHVLAISGMHMGIIAGTLFWLLRAVMALSPYLALHYPIKKWAAGLALLGAAAYLGISGASVSTQRAFIMTSIFLLAIIINRPALSLRNVALAALIILLVMPESLMTPGFQMSFAAATALVAFYQWSVSPAGRRVLPRLEWPKDASVSGRIWRYSWLYFTGISATTIIASVAVAPFGIWHFNTFATYSLAGNLFAMPLVGSLVMPMVLMTLFALPFGVEAWPLFIMAYGLMGVENLAQWVASWDNARLNVENLTPLTFALLVLGGLWLCLWSRVWRLFGVIAIAAGLFIAPARTQPDILVEREGRVVAVRQADGRFALLGKRHVNFSSLRWLSADGDDRTRAMLKAARWKACDALGCIAQTQGLTVAFAQNPAALNEDCRNADIVITSFYVNQPCRPGTLMIDRGALQRAGAHAVYITNDRVMMVKTVAQSRGKRPWNQAKKQHKFHPRKTKNGSTGKSPADPH